MTDAATKRHLKVSGEGLPKPTLTLPLSQLDEVRQLFDAHGIRYWVSENYISFNGGPEEAFIIFGYGTDAAAVQAILDSVH